jgi:iron complex outermembrane receptor protein
MKQVKKHLKRTSLSVSMIVAIATMQSATAQEQVTSLDNTATSENADVEVIMVQATRRSENIQEVPVSITQLGGETLEKSGLQNLTDVSSFVPNFHISTSNQTNNTRLTIRGVGSVGNSAIEGSVGVFVDGVYYARPGSVLGNMAAIESIEILRGPQGTLFGRNTPMGALNISTLDPTDTFDARTRLSLGNFGAVNAFAYVSGELTENINANVTINSANRDGFGFNEFTNSEFGKREDLSLRSKLIYEISDKTRVKLVLDMAKLSNEGPVVEILEDTKNPVFIGTTQALFGTAAGTESTFDRVVNQQNDDEATDKQSGISLEFNHTFSNDFQLKSISAMRTWESDYENEGTLRLPAELLPRNTFFEHDMLSQEFQILSPDSDSYEYVVGAYLYQEDYNISQNFDAGAQFCAPVAFAIIRGNLIRAGRTPEQATQIAQAQAAACGQAPQFAGVNSEFEQELSSYALFYHGTHYLTEQWKLSLGGRFSNDDKDGSFEQVLNNPFFSLVRAPESAPDLSFSDSKFTYLANLSYQVNKNHMLFATASTGFKSGGFNSQGGASSLEESRIFDSETTKNYELGYKGTLFDGATSFNATVFRTDIADFQDRSFDGLSFVTTNAGELRQQGLEIDFRSSISENLSVLGGFGFLDSEFLSYPSASPLPGNEGTQDLSGKRNHRSPKVQASLLIDYSQEFANDYLWYVRPGWSYIGEQNLGGDTNQNPQTLQAGYSLVNLRVGVENYTSGWSVELFVNNATDAEYCGGMFDQPLGSQIGAVNGATNTTVIRCVVGDPRTYGVQFSYQFD